MQGESDAIEGHGGEYATNLTNLIASVRADFGNPNLPFMFGQIIDFDLPNTRSSVVRAKQQQVANDRGEHGIHFNG